MSKLELRKGHSQDSLDIWLDDYRIGTVWVNSPIIPEDGRRKARRRRGDRVVAVCGWGPFDSPVHSKPLWGVTGPLVAMGLNDIQPLYNLVASTGWDLEKLLEGDEPPDL